MRKKAVDLDIFLILWNRLFASNCMADIYSVASYAEDFP